MASKKATFIVTLKDKFSPQSKKVAASTDKMRAKMDRMSLSAAKSKKRMAALAVGAKKLAKGFLVAGAAAGAFGVKSLWAAAQEEKAQISFGTMLGGLEKGKKLYQELKVFAAATPFQMEGLGQSTKLLLAYGVSATDVLPKLKMLGDISAATGADLNLLTLSYAQVRSQGRIMGGDVREFAMKGVNIKQALADKYGKSVQQVSEEISAGKYSAAHLDLVLKDLTSAGGLAHGATSALSRSIEGIWSTVKDNAGFAMAAIGNLIVKSVDIKGAADTTVSRLQRFTEYIDKLQSISDLLHDIKNVFPAPDQIVAGGLTAFGAPKGLVESNIIGDYLLNPLWKTKIKPVAKGLSGLYGYGPGDEPYESAAKTNRAKRRYAAKRHGEENMTKVQIKLDLPPGMTGTPIKTNDGNTEIDIMFGKNMSSPL